MSIVFIIFLACIILYCIHSAREVDKYNKSQYRKITKNSFWDVEFDKGKNGEYKIYKSLFHYEMDGASFLFNCYLPMENKETTEIDDIIVEYMYLKAKIMVVGFSGMNGMHGGHNLY